MLKRRSILLMIVVQLIVSSLALAADKGVPIICYHDVGGTVNNEYSVTKETLINHLSYLKVNGYHPISLEQYIAYMKDGAPLPEKPVMLTFDDGYISFYNEVFPLLKQYNYPAVFAIVGSWLEYAPADLGKLVSWQQLRELDASGLVTIASHSFRSHHFTIINPQGDRGEFLSALTYDNGRYETMDEFHKRVYDDLEQSQQQFQKELGHKVQGLVWPYGEYNLPAIEIAKQNGFEAMLGLGGGMNVVGQKGLVEARRGIIMNNPNTLLFASFIKSGGLDNNPMKAAYLDISTVYDPNNVRGTANNLNLAIARFNRAGINTVFIQVLSEEKSDSPESAYFHTTAIPVKADIFSHIASRLRNEGFLVYATMPTLTSQWLIKEHPEDQMVTNNPQNSSQSKVTPFSPTISKKLVDLYRDLGAYAYVDGILFQDELYLNDEDFSPAAKAAFQHQFGKELTTEVLKDELIRKQWTKLKMETVQNLKIQLMKAVQVYRPYALFAQSIAAESLLDQEGGKTYFAETYEQYLDSYDYIVIKTNPFSNHQKANDLQWLGKLAELALVESGAAAKVTFQLQTFDDDKNAWIKDKDLKAEIDMLRSKGVNHFIYNPDIVFEDKAARVP
jgi:biofilm PGA synthesis lipoprotein PgaB